MAKNKLEPITAEDLYSFKYPYNVSYNKSGSRIAFTVTTPDKKTNGYQNAVYCIENNEVKQLTYTLNAVNMCWLNDDELLLSRKNEESDAGTSDVYKINVTGGEAEAYLHVNFPLSSITPLDNGKYIALGTIDACDPDAYLDDEKTRKEKLAKKEEEKDYQVIDEIPYWRNGQGFTNKQRKALFVIDDKKVKRITSPFEDVREYAVDEDTVYYLSLKWKETYARVSHVYSYDTNTKEKKTWYDKDDRAINNLFVKDHELFAQVSDMKEYGSHETGNISKIVEGGFETIVDPLRSLNDSASGDTTYGFGKENACVGKNFYTLATDDDRVCIWKYDADFNKIVVFDQAGLVTCLDANSGKIAFIYEDSSHLCEVFEMNEDGSDIKQKTYLNEECLKNKYIAKPERIDYESTDTKLHGWVLYPKDFNPKKKYPAVLDIHGGSRAIYSEALSHEMQIWASCGFFVFFTNIRGSDGLDDAFADINGHFGDIDYQNIMDFTDAVLAKYPNIDASKLCETGGSYGGFMSNWIVTHTDRFCAIATQRSISNWFTKIFISDIGFWYNAEQHNASDVFNNMKNLWDASPLKYAKGATTPTLFIHSDEDYRCPLPEGMQLFQALAYQNVETKMVIFHGENHALSRNGKPEHRIRRLNEITNWFISHTEKKGK